MGKGGTRFIADAVAVRDGPERTSFTARELKHDMDIFCETGVHPDIEQAVEEHQNERPIAPLPQVDLNRPFLYFQFSIGNEPVGRITVELFDAYNVQAVEKLQSKCREASKQALRGTRVYKLLPGFAFFMGSPKSVDCLTSL